MAANKYAGVAKAFGSFLTIDDLPDTTSIPNAPTAQPSPFESVGAPGATIHQGWLVPDEKDSRLVGVKKYTHYSDLLANVAIVGAGCRFFLSLVGKSDWSLEPADDSAEAQKYADLVEDILHDMEVPWHNVVRRAALYRFYGFSIQEWTAKQRDDGNVGLLSVRTRAQSTVWRWDCDMHGRVKGVVQLMPQTSRELYIPRAKLIYAVDDSLNDNPEGLGLFRHIVKAADKLTFYELMEARGFESDIRGIPLLRAPITELKAQLDAGKIDKTTYEAILKPLRDFMDNHVKSPRLASLMDSEPYRSKDAPQAPSSVPKFSVEMLRGDNGPHEDMAKAIERLTREIALVLGVEHLLLGSSSKGSHAMASDKRQSLGESVDGTLADLRALFRKDLLEPLFELNGWPKEMIPSFCTSPIQYREIEQVTLALFQMAQAGAPLAPDDPAINAVRRLIGLPEAPEMDPALLAATQNAAAGLLPDGTHPAQQPQDDQGDQGDQGNQGDQSGSKS